MRCTKFALVLLLACGCAGSFGRRATTVRTSDPTSVPQPLLAPQPNLKPQPPSEALRDFLASRRDPGVPAEPRIGPGDVIRVDVADVEEASRQYSVSASGKVRLPLAGQVSLAGKSVEEAAAEIARRLETFVVNPSVRVKLVDVVGDEATIQGAVERPGRIGLGRKGKTLLEALSAAGGLTSDASGAIRITPGTSAPPGLFADQPPAAAEPIELAATDLVRADGPARLYLRPGDRIEVVPKSGAVASAAPDQLAELDPPPAEASDVEAEEEEPPLAEPEPSRSPGGDRTETRLARKAEADEPEIAAREPLAVSAAPNKRRSAPHLPPEPPPSRSEPARGRLAPVPESSTILTELEALRRRVEAHEAQSQNKGRQAEDQSATIRREVETARAEAEEARQRYAAERERAQALSARLAELEAGRGGATAAPAGESTPSSATTVFLREQSIAPESDSGRGGLFSIFGAGDDESEPDELAAADVAPPSARPPSHVPQRAPRVAAATAPPGSVPPRRPAPPPSVARADARIGVVGRVENQGDQPLADARTVSGAVARAELAPGADVSRIEVRRGSGDEEWRILVNLIEVQGGRSPDVMLEDGDTIFVP